ncbi:MAG: glutamyl-tRNA reductase [Armatimonadota bacterium]
MHVELVGLSHKTAPVEVRERVSFSRKNLLESLPLLTGLEGVAEGMIMSTCNRTEIYAAAGDGCHPHDQLRQFLCLRHQVPPEQLLPHLYSMEDAAAVRHLYSVAAGVESMVVGESEVLGQLREAAAIAKEEGALRGPLQRLMDEAIRVGKLVRTETGVSRGSLSVASVAVNLAQSIFADLAQTVVLVLGAGETGELVVRHLLAEGVPSVIVSNRTYERALELAAEFGGEAIKFDEFPGRLASADIVIGSTAAPRPVLRRDTVAQAMRERSGEPLFLIDIAVPRDVEPAVGEMDSVYLYDIDDLEAVVAQNAAEREREVARAQEIIEEETAAFLRWLRQRSITPTIVELKEHVESILAAESHRMRNKFSTDRDRELAERLAQGIANKLLSQPFQQLKRSARARDGHAMAEAVRRLFGLDLREK